MGELDALIYAMIILSKNMPNISLLGCAPDFIYPLLLVVFSIFVLVCESNKLWKWVNSCQNFTTTTLGLNLIPSEYTLVFVLILPFYIFYADQVLIPTTSRRVPNSLAMKTSCWAAILDSQLMESSHLSNCFLIS